MSKQCSAKNRNGQRCGAWAVTGETQCALHSDPECAARMGAKHGRKAVLPINAQGPTVESEKAVDIPKTANQVRDVLAETIVQIRGRKVDTRTANALAYVATSLLRAIEVSELENRLNVLEGRRGHDYGKPKEQN
jgi:hypothetical protein